MDDLKLLGFIGGDALTGQHEWESRLPALVYTHVACKTSTILGPHEQDNRPEVQ